MPLGEAHPTTLDKFLGGRLVVRQPERGYRAGLDPVFLAAAVPAHSGDRVLDLGCGIGTAALCLLARVAGVHATGLELQPHLAELARANAEANQMADRLTVVEGCLTRPPSLLRGQGFDHVLTNPPWYEAGTATAPPVASKAAGHMEGAADLEAWLRVAVTFLKHKGRLTLIHRADRLADILVALKRRAMGEITVFPLFPKPGRPAVRVVVSARRGVKTPMELLPGMVMHREDGGYSGAAEAVLRHGAALF